MGDYSSLNINRTEAHTLNHQEVENTFVYNKDPHKDARNSLKRLQSWREESQREFSNISICINKGINDLIEEICALQDELSVTRKERNDLIQTVSNLSGEIRKLNTKLNITKPVENDLHNIEEESLEMEVTDTDQEQDVDKSVRSSEDEDNEENIDNDWDIEQVALDKEIINSKNELVETGTKLNENVNSLSLPAGSKHSYDNNSENHICPECRFAFSTNENLKIHLRNLHPPPRLRDESPPDDEEEKGQTDISRISESDDNCNNGETENITNEKGDKKFKCEQCPYTSAHKENVKKHIEAVHEKTKHVCKYCGYAATHRISLKRHIEAVHEDMKEHVCKECGYATSYKNALKRHIEGVHENIKHVCNECGFAASRKDNLSQHIMAVHKNIRNHVCGECGYAASQKSHLKNHIEAVHENIKHVCGECGYAASQNGNLNTHRKSVHKMGEKKS